MKLDERILRELECEQTEVPPRTGSIDSVMARGKRRKVLTSGAVALASAAVVVAVVGVSAWVARPGGGSADVAAERAETWTTYTEADGLDVNCASGLAVAADGTLWAVAPAGVFRFDGSSWIAESAPPGFRPGCEARVAAAPDGAMWLAGGYESGAARYDAGSWTVIDPFNIEEWGGFLDIAVTGDGTVWAVEGDHLTRLVGDSFDLVDEEFEPIPGHQIREDRNPISASITVGADGTLWAVGGPGGNISRLYNVTGSAPPVVIEMGGQGPGSLLGVAPDGALWFSAEYWGNTADGDVGLLLRFADQIWTSYPIGGVGGAAFEPDGTAWFIVGEIAGDDLLWRTQYAEPGAYRFGGEGWRLVTVDDGLAGVDLTSVATTADGSIWFGTDSNGVTRYEPGTNPAAGTPVDIVGSPYPTDEWRQWPATTTAPPVTQAP